MSVILQATSGPSAGMKIVVPRGQVAHVGRTKWADHCIPGDASLAEIHFVIDYTLQNCRIRDMSGGSGTSLNGEIIATEAQLHSGDRIIAGQSTFAALVQGEPLPAAATPAAADAVEGSPTAKIMARDYAGQLELGAEAVALLHDGQPPIEFLDLLVAAELYPDALKFLAFWLPAPLSVTWGCWSLESVAGDRLAGTAKNAFQAARRWSTEPTEKNRRKAEAAAEAAKYDGPAAFLALAAFWSGGSLAPEGLAEVPPPEGLTAQGVTAALLMAANQGPPADIGNRYRSFLKQGRKMAQELPES